MSILYFFFNPFVMTLVKFISKHKCVYVYSCCGPVGPSYLKIALTSVICIYEIYEYDFGINHVFERDFFAGGLINIFPF